TGSLKRRRNRPLTLCAPGATSWCGLGIERGRYLRAAVGYGGRGARCSVRVPPPVNRLPQTPHTTRQDPSLAATCLPRSSSRLQSAARQYQKGEWTMETRRIRQGMWTGIATALVAAVAGSGGVVGDVAYS